MSTNENQQFTDNPSEQRSKQQQTISVANVQKIASEESSTKANNGQKTIIKTENSALSPSSQAVSSQQVAKKQSSSNPTSNTSNTPNPGAKPNQTQDALFNKKMYYVEKDYFKTKSKNLISKRCLIKSSDNIEIYDHAIIQQKIILRADLAKIFIGRYVILNEGVIIKPPFRRQNAQIRHIPVEVGSHVFVDKGTIIQAVKIGSYVKIGKDCIIGQRVIIGDCCVVLDGTVIPADAQLAASSVYGGKPALYMGELPESASIVQKQSCISYFDNFIQTNKVVAGTETKKPPEKQEKVQKPVKQEQQKNSSKETVSKTEMKEPKGKEPEA